MAICCVLQDAYVLSCMCVWLTATVGCKAVDKIAQALNCKYMHIVD